MKQAVIISTILIVTAGLLGNYIRFSSRTATRLPSFEHIPYRVDGYLGEEDRFADGTYEILKADTTTLRLYHGPDGMSFRLFVAYFSSQKYGSQIHSPQHCLPGSGWKIEKRRPFCLDLPGGIKKQVNRALIIQRDQRRLMFYWYETRAGAIANEFELKWELMKNSLLLRPTDAVFIRLTVPLEQKNVKQATTEAIRFLGTFHLYLEAAHPLSN